MNGSTCAGVVVAGVATTTAASDAHVDMGWSGCSDPRFPAPTLASCGLSIAASELFLDTLWPPSLGEAPLGDPVSALSPLSNFVVFSVLSPGGALGTGDTVIHDLIGCKCSGI